MTAVPHDERQHLSRSRRMVAAEATDPATDAVDASAADIELAGQLGRALTRLMRVSSRAKAQAAADGSRADLSLVPLLVALSDNGSMRSNALAEAVFSDPSTVSRQVAHLVDVGYVERRPDPTDKRACQLVVTDAGCDALAAHRQARDEHLARVMTAWPATDRRCIAALIDRLAGDLADDLHLHTSEAGTSRLQRQHGESS